MPLEAGPPQAKEALAYWRAKAPVTKAEFDQLSEKAKQRAFAVAGLARREQVAQIHAALTSALEKGETLTQFKKRIGGILEQKGWTGNEAWRIENIYRTNMQSAHMAGRYAQMKRASKTRPYWRYIAVKDKRTRPSHAALNGKVFPHDHDFWDHYYPPNGFRCRCSVQTLSQRQVEDRGLEVDTEIPRLVTPDPGFYGNVGRNWMQGLSPSELPEGKKITSLVKHALCRKGEFALSQLARGRECKPDLRKLDPRHIFTINANDLLKAGLANEDYVMAFLKEFGLHDLNGETNQTLPTGLEVPINRDLFWDKRKKIWKAIRQGRGPYMKLLARTLKSPYEIWAEPISVKGRETYKIKLIRLFKTPNGDIAGFSVFKLLGKYWQGSTIFPPMASVRKRAEREAKMYRYLDNERDGVVIFREQ
jgi:SPP1 gp7 family putative phage head morphogenesis protein